MANLHFDVQGYADDLVVTVRGVCQDTLSHRMQRALNTIEKWCIENELTVNADKTVIIPFTRKRKIDNLKPPKLKNIRYLGVTLDKKMTWNSHINGVLKKAKSALGICGRLAGNRWGMKPKITFWLYTAIVRPIVSYASVVWSNKTTVKTQNKLSSLQRSACLLITGAMSTTPGDALDALLNLPPLHLHVRKEAKACMYRLTSQGVVNWLPRELRHLHNSVLGIPVLGMPTDSITPKLNFLRQYTVEIPNRIDWLENRITWKPGSLKWYTDGSKSGSNVGCGIFEETTRVGLQRNLGVYTSIFQAEVFAIIECAETCLLKNVVLGTKWPMNLQSQALWRSKLAQSRSAEYPKAWRNSPYKPIVITTHSFAGDNSKE
ncbi:uncharacterized protein LOC120635572 [Pararge aegeria]|uniref:uncharacterized protein LOC120635572 n=1 Tax=Pararge aegeria TaxID=116150 RepID=UPI0019D2EF9D|nr:uncharacterized protein LOC120635572 [Pararge aegeria]